MKKILALLLALVLVVGLCACGGSGSGGQSDAAKEVLNSEKDTAKKYPNQNPDGTINLDKIAHFDADFDYANNAKHEKLAYLAASGTVLYQLSADAYEHWCPLFGLEWAGFFSSDGDSDLYLTNLQTQIDQGVKGFILDPDSTIFPAVLEILEQHPDVFWMSQMSPRVMALPVTVFPSAAT